MNAEPSHRVRPGGPVRTVEAEDIDPERFREVLRRTLDLLEEAGIRHVIMGGLAVAALARPRWTHDIDLFVRPDDAERVLAVLRDAGYETERTDPLWLFKAERDSIPVDIIFRSEGGFYLDEQVWEHSRTVTFDGMPIRVIAPEDLVIIKACAHQEGGGYHWFDALALLTREDIDWGYLTERSRRAVRGVLSLLLYADSQDIAIPASTIRRLFDLAYGERRGAEERDGGGAPRPRA